MELTCLWQARLQQPRREPSAMPKSLIVAVILDRGVVFFGGSRPSCFCFFEAPEWFYEWPLCTNSFKCCQGQRCLCCFWSARCLTPETTHARRTPARRHVEVASPAMRYFSSALSRPLPPSSVFLSSLSGIALCTLPSCVQHLLLLCSTSLSVNA